jgi:DNA/RNA-binding domain of Phe-tRNA-synthetase-like protein
VQVALQAGLIDLSDAIDIREVRSIKLANQLLKVKQKKRQERLQEENQANIQAQADANAQAQQVAAQAEIQKYQSLFSTKSQL